MGKEKQLKHENTGMRGKCWTFPRIPIFQMELVKVNYKFQAF